MAEHLASFMALHGPALRRDEVRHNLILGLIARAEQPGGTVPALWTLGEAGACAIRAGIHNIVLGEVSRAQAAALAEATADLSYPGVVGPDRTAEWFAARAAAMGLAFDAPMPQRIYALRDAPRYPGAPGAARVVTEDDATLLGDWVAAFVAEAVPHDSVPTDAEIARMAASGRYFFWEAEGAPVAMAAIARETPNAATISLVYTPPDRRGRGFGGSVTAAVVEAAFARGKTAACLYTDLRNPISNRCYVKIGFAPVCESRFYRRIGA